MDWNIIFKGFLLGFLLANFEPLQDFLSKYVKPKIPNKLEYFRTALSCFKCLSFWSALIMSQDVFVASAASLLAFTYDKVINSFRMYI